MYVKVLKQDWMEGHAFFDFNEGRIYEATIASDAGVEVEDNVGERWILKKGEYEVVE